MNIFACYKNDSLPRGYQGIVDREGLFIPLGTINDEAYHQMLIKDYIDNVLGIDIIGLYNAKKDSLEKDVYKFRENIYDYKALLIDFLGYSLYEAYKNTSFASIEIPIKEVNGLKVTKEQEKTLFELVHLNGNDIASLLPIVLDSDIAFSNAREQSVANVMMLKKKTF